MNHEALSLFGATRSREQLIAAILDGASRRGMVDAEERRFLEELLADPPGPEGSGLDPGRHAQFLAATLQHIEICLQHRDLRRPGFINGVLQRELDRDGGGLPAGRGWRLAEIRDPERRGVDRTKTFGQVQENPGDPDSPSFFGGTWIVTRNGESRRIVFSIHADAVPRSTVITPFPDGHPDGSRMRAMVTARGPAHWELQIEPPSPLGRWIARVAGSESIGQLRGQIPLGVLSEATKRALTPLGATHMLLGPSRRDPPSRAWHTGRFLDRVDGEYRFRWAGFALDGDARLITARTEIEIRARIVAELSLES